MHRKPQRFPLRTTGLELLRLRDCPFLFFLLVRAAVYLYCLYSWPKEAEGHEVEYLTKVKATWEEVWRQGVTRQPKRGVAAEKQ